MTDRVTEQTTIAASPEVVRAVLLDFPRYPEWAKDLKEVEVLTTDDQGRGTEVRFRAAGMGRSTSYVLRYDLSDEARVAWKLTEGDIVRKLDGHYEFHADPADPGVTVVDYELEAELIVPIPGFVKRRTQGRIMHAALRELKTHVETSAS
ncbi:MAG: SRPBCC family protein [Aquihabitans sp.]